MRIKQTQKCLDVYKKRKNKKVNYLLVKLWQNPYMGGLTKEELTKEE